MSTRRRTATGGCWSGRWRTAHGSIGPRAEVTSAAARLDRREVLEWLHEHFFLDTTIAQRVALKYDHVPLLEWLMVTFGLASAGALHGN